MTGLIWNHLHKICCFTNIMENKWPDLLVADMELTYHLQSPNSLCEILEESYHVCVKFYTIHKMRVCEIIYHLSDYFTSEWFKYFRYMINESHIHTIDWSKHYVHVCWGHQLVTLSFPIHGFRVYSNYSNTLTYSFLFCVLSFVPKTIVIYVVTQQLFVWSMWLHDWLLSQQSQLNSLIQIRNAPNAYFSVVPQGPRG